jgi:signal transduction histidine kinase
MRRRLLLSWLALTLFVLFVLEIPLGVTFAHRQLSELTAEVERDAVVTATLVEDTLETGGAVDVSRVLTDYAHQTGARVVVVDARGVAVADSAERSSPGTADIGESFTNRPEVSEALKGRVATGTRHSVTLGAELLYVAVPVASGGVVHGAVRITYPTSELDARVTRGWLTLVAVAAVSLVAAGMLAVGLAGWVSRPLQRLQRVAADIGAGRLDSRAPTGDGPPEVRALAAAMNDTAARLAGLMAAQDAFVADASHQLRNPLTALRLRLENLETEVNSDAEDDLQAAVAETRRLSRTVDGLLAMARADRAAGQGPAGVLDPMATLEDRWAAWAPLAEERGVTLTVERGAGPVPKAARATPDRLVQVLDNLIANALEAAPAGTRIILSAKVAPAEDRVELHVLDEGPSLSEEEQVRAFDRFWRGPNAARSQNGLGGSGLGLSIVRRLVAADGGDVELAGRPGGGTDAVVRLGRGTGRRAPGDTTIVGLGDQGVR